MKATTSTSAPGPTDGMSSDLAWPRGGVPVTDAAATGVAAAHGAFRGWRDTAPAARATALRTVADSVRQHADELAESLCDTTGRLLEDARASAQVAADLFDEAAVAGLGVSGRTLAGGSAALDWVRAEPHGVVAVLTPWNDPFPAAAGLIAAALVTGNTVVHKPSERSLEPGMALARLVAEALPAGVMTPVPGDGVVGARIVRDDRVRLVAHIGSTATGQLILQQCAARGARAIVENGGKDALVVDAGVDARWAAGQIAVGAFTNAGQLCTSVERVYLHEAVADAVVDELVGLAATWRAGDPKAQGTTLCRLVDEAQLEVVDRHVQDAIAHGANPVAGGQRLDRAGPWYAPTVLTGCTADMTVMAEETFGPVAPVQVVSSWASGLDAAGASAYGLAATVLTADPSHALQAVQELDVGTVKVNAVFGGAPGGSADPRRGSGRGRGYGPDLLGEMTLLKAVHWSPVPG